jgi:AcrR family transcriptional regulator
MPKIVDKKTKRIEIAKIAMELFAEQGFENTPVREITARAGIGKGSLYDYFINKEDILNEIVQLIFTQWSEFLLKEIKDMDDPIQQLQILLKEGASLGVTFKQSMIMYIDIWRRSVSKKGSDEFIQNFQNYLIHSKENITNIVQIAQKKGLVKEEIDPGAFAFALIALIDGICLHSMILKKEIDIGTLSQSIFEMLLNGIKT